MKIVFSLHRYAPATAGSEVYAQGVCEHLVARGHEVTVVCTDRLPDGARYRPLVETRAGVHVLRVTGRGPGAWLARLHRPRPAPIARPIAARLAGRIRTARPELIVALPVPRQSVLAAAAARAALGVPAVAVPFYHTEFRGFLEHEPAWMETLRTFEAVFATTSAEADFLAARGIDARRIRRPGMWAAAPPAVDDREGIAWRRAHGIEDRFLVVTAAAEFSAAKGMATLAAAAAALPEVAFVFLGGTERSRAWLRHAVPLGANVHLPGFVSESEKATAFRAADLFAMPSRAESFGIVYIEAQFAGTPVLAADVSAVREVVGDGGIHVPFGDVDAVAAAVRTLRDDAAARRTLAARARANAERFTAPAALNRIGDELERVAAAHRA